VQVVGDVAQLDHGGHVFRIFACATHVKTDRARASACATAASLKTVYR
jgi:hypothetical protein